MDHARPVPAWRRSTAGEHRWPAALAVVAAIVLQLLLPDRMVLSQARYLLPGLELALLVLLVAVNPFRMNRESGPLRVGGLVLTGLVVTSNAISVGLLVTDLLRGTPTSPGDLLAAGATVWLTNVIAFALVFWELDRGGPAARAAGRHDHPDFAFAQMQSPELAPHDWEPAFADYFYLAFTNATAVQPHRRPAAVALGEDAHAGAVGAGADGGGPGGGAGRERAGRPVTGEMSVGRGFLDPWPSCTGTAATPSGCARITARPCAPTTGSSRCP